MASKSINAYAAFDSTGKCKTWQYTSRPLGDADIEVKISHCGICGTDVHTLDSGWGPANYPVVAGHEIIGEVTMAGPNVKNLAVGDRVGVGCQVWACLNKQGHACRECADGADAYCKDIVFTYNAAYKDGTPTYGGYAEYIRLDSEFAFKIPDNIPSAEAAPLLCAGVTVFGPLNRENVKAGDRVGVIGIGGLGHLAIQFIRALGATPVAFSRSSSKEKEIRELGAEEFYDLSNPEHQTQAVESVDMLLLTADAPDMPYNMYLGLIRKRGTLVQLAVPNGEAKFLPFFVVGKGIKWMGSFIGSVQDVKDMLKVASEKNVRPVIQKLPMSKVNEGLDMVRQGRARYRVVLEN
jgi:alcohol dehydrogenase (NADP+)